MVIALTKEIAFVREASSADVLLLAKDAIDNAFQPIVEASTGIVFGYESLMRGHERIGFDSPMEMLDAAERAGQLLALEQMVTGLALAKYPQLPNPANATLFLNLDVRLIPQGPLLVESLVDALASRGIPTSNICFEFSERFDNSSFSEFAALVLKMRRQGFKLAIDDFGVGHAEMKLLCDHAVDYLKIDKHFVSGIEQNARKRHMLKNIVNMAHVLGARVVAEGIETEAEFLCCQDFGVDLVQGWFIARPTADVSQLASSYPLPQLVKAKDAILDDILIRRQMEVLPAVTETDSIDSVFELFRRNPRQAYFPVLNANREPRGIIHEFHLKSYIYQPFGRDLLKNKAYERTISHFVESAPVVGIDSGGDNLMAVFARMEGSDCVIVVENMRYAGVISAASLIKVMNEKLLKSAQDQNPLTGLPGNHAIRDFMRISARAGGEARYFCYCDFDHFKPFNDVYGFDLGDRAISLFAALMRRYFFVERHFLGHVGGDDFFIGTTGWTAPELADILERMCREFHEDVLEFYSREDRAAGHIRGHDRQGADAVFPFMRCSIGVIELPAGCVIEDIGEIITAIAGIKAKAKESESGLVFHRLGETN